MAARLPTRATKRNSCVTSRRIYKTKSLSRGVNIRQVLPLSLLRSRTQPIRNRAAISGRIPLATVLQWPVAHLYQEIEKRRGNIMIFVEPVKPLQTYRFQRTEPALLSQRARSGK